MSAPLITTGRDRMLEHRDPNGEVTAYSYDVRGLLVETVVTVPGDGDRPGVCETATPTITGTSGSTLLIGTSGVDIIFGNGGDIVVVGGGGDDVICAGDGLRAAVRPISRTR